MKQFLQGREDLEPEFRQAEYDYRRKVGRILVFLGIPFFLGYAGYWFYQQNYLLVLIHLVGAGALALWLAGYLKRRSQSSDKYDQIAIMACLGGILAIHAYLLGYAKLWDRLAWAIVYPMVAIIVLGRRRGMLWSCAYLLLVLYVGFFVDFKEDALERFTLFKISVMILYVISLGTTYALEKVREETHLELFKKEARLRQEVKERQRAEDSLRQLASGVAHNFNNYLMAIASNLQAAQELLAHGEADHPQAHRLLNNALVSAVSGGELVKRLNRAALGEKSPKDAPAPLDLGQLILQARDIATQAWASDPATLSFPADLEPGLWVMARRGEMMEVFLNLFKNSLEVLPPEGLVKVKAHRQGQRILVEVEDRGPGISPEMAGRLFQPFASDKNGFGQGLGLVVSKGIITAMQGGIRCESRPGQGTAVYLDLPACPEGAAGPPDLAGEAPVGQGQRVLLVEDEGLTTEGLTVLLGNNGWQVAQARDVREAALKIREFAPQLIISDFGLPDGNAWQVARAAEQWAAEQGGPPPPLLVLSGWSRLQMENQRPPQAPEPAAWLQKPVQKAELLRALQAALSRV